MKYSAQDIQQMERIKRLTFINSVSGYKCPCLIGTTDGRGNHNLAIFNTVMHIGSNPPLLGMIVRPVSVPRHTYANIIATGEYTINHVHSDIVAQSHQTSANYPEEVSEFEAVGLTAEISSAFMAPFVEEANVKIAMRLKEELDIKSNGTKLLVGEIQFIVIPEDSQRDDESLDLIKCGTIAMSGLHSYYDTDLIARYAYARPDDTPMTF